MAAAKQGQGLARRAEQFTDPLDIGSAHLFKAQLDRATAALAQAGAQHVADPQLLRLAGQESTGMRDGLVFEVAAANGGRKTVGKDEHAGATAARDGAFHIEHGDENGRCLGEVLQGGAQRDQGASCCKR